MLAVENGGVGGVPEIGEQPVRFLVLVAKRLHADGVRRFDIGRELLVEQPWILGEHAPRGLEDLPRAPAVLVEDDRLDLEVAAEPFEHHGIGAGPGEDRLLVIADRVEVAVRRGEPLQEIVLDRVHVLEFVHQEIVPPPRNLLGHRVAQQPLGLHDEIVEVHHVAVREPACVFAIEPRFIGLERILLEAVTAEPAQHPTPPLDGHAQTVQDHVLIRLVGDTKAALQACRLGKLAQ